MNNEENICSICYEPLNQSDSNLECGHTFHSSCIIKWFRSGKQNCPLCNDTSIDTSNLFYRTKIETISQIKKLGRKKSCPLNIKKTLEDIKKADINLKAINKEQNEFKKEYKVLIKKYNSFSVKKWRTRRKIRDYEHKLLAMITLNPIYIK
tara:strand:+ start:535 stop:987 length:453 start_codon:yes stop_codon:yes gene_type:complete